MTVAAGTVELRTVWLDTSPDELARATSLLSTDERARAERFVFARHGRRFTVCRAALRTALGRHLDTRPDDLRFEYSDKGKPRLCGRHAASRLSFNVSHSGELAVIALAIGRELGVDVEQLRPVENFLSLADRVFSPLERQRLAATFDGRNEAFLACWTRKEAYVKARGDGLAANPAGFTVSIGKGEPTRIVAVEGDPAEAARWWLTDIEPAAGFVGALASRGEPALVRWWPP